MGTKKGRIYDKGAPFKGAPQRFRRAVAPNCPPPFNPPLKTWLWLARYKKYQ